MEFRLVSDWTQPGLSLDFLTPLPFLLLGIYLLKRGRSQEMDKGFLFGSATVNGLIITVVSFAAFSYSTYNAVTDYNDRVHFVTTNLFSFEGEISKLYNQPSEKINSLAIDGQNFGLYQPISTLRYNNTPQLGIGQMAKILFVKTDQKNIVVKLEVENKTE